MTRFTTYDTHLQNKARAHAIQQGKLPMPASVRRDVEAAERDGYLSRRNTSEGDVAEALWFERCELADRTYAYLDGAKFHVDLIAQSYGMDWRRGRLAALFDKLEPLCNRGFALICGCSIVYVYGVREENREQVAKTVLQAVEENRARPGEGSGYADRFTRSYRPPTTDL